MYGDEFVFDLQRFESSGNSTISSGNNSFITKGGFYEIAQGFTGGIYISTTDAVTLDGADAGSLEKLEIYVHSETANLTIKDLNVSESGRIDFGVGTDNKLTLSGTNELKGCVYIGGGLTIDGDGSLKGGISGGICGESSANLAILGGKISGSIGPTPQSSMGDILIGGNATVEANGGWHSAGIGSVYSSSVGNIRITDNAHVSAKGNFGAGIGTAGVNALDENHNPDGWSTAGNIIIDGNATVKALSNVGAAIGNGSSYCGHTTVGNILIGGNANVEAICAIHDSGVGGGYGTGIGNGYTGEPGSTSKTGNITITDEAQVVAKNYGYGLGLGKGITDYGATNTMGKIIFSGGNVTIQNSGSDGSIEINGKVYSPEEKMVFVNGEFVADGNDAKINWDINTSVTGTKKSDLIYNYGSNVLINAKGGNDDIFNMASDVTINAGNGNNFITSRDDNVSIKAGKGNDSISAYGRANTIDAGDGNNAIYNYESEVSIKTGAGSDTVMHLGYGTNPNIVGVTVTGGKFDSTIDTGAGNDSIDNSAALVSINAGAGNDTIGNSGSFSMINAGDGDDYIKISGGKNFTINAGKGDDYIEHPWWNYAKNNLFTYDDGDGNDLIQGFHKNDTLQIGGGTGTYSTAVDGKNIIVTVGEGKISLVGVASLSAVNIDGKEKNSWKINGKTATYGTLKKTLAKVKGVKSTNGLSLKKNIVTVSEASLNKKKVTVSDGYKLKLGSDVYKPKNQKAAWSLSGSTATYKSAYKTAGYALAGDKKSVVYSAATKASDLATVKGAKSTNGLNLSGKKITLKNSALSKNVTISGDYEFDFAADYKQATITGSSKADTITAHGSKVSINAGAGDDTIKIFGSANTVAGGKGADVFVYESGKNFIADYAADDKIYLGAAISKTTLNGSDVVFTTDKGSLTVQNGKGKTLNLIDSAGEKYSTVLGGTTLTLTDAATSSVIVDDSVKVINASKRTAAIKITGNALDNKISGGAGNDKLHGGAGNDTLVGGAGNDSLWGNAGADKFIYASGDGDDVIFGFDDKDTLTLDGLDFNSSYKNEILTLKVDGGLITLKDFSAKTFHINDDTYKISGSKLIK